MISNEQIYRYIQELDEIDTKISKAGVAWAEANQAAERYTELRKSVLAQMVTELKENPEKGSKALSTLETMGRADQRYIQWIEDMTKYNQCANEKRIEYTKHLNRQKALITMISLGKELARIR